MHIITEVKTASPFGWRSDKSWDELFEIADKIGDMISVHTDPRWEGSLELVAKARGLTSKPILAKGIHAKDKDISRALAAGADFVLVVGRVPKTLADRCLIEPTTLDELKELPTNLKAVWNSRDLRTGGKKRHGFSEARQVFSGWLCQASNITAMTDVDPSADAVLVGSHLAGFADSIKSC